LQLTDDLIIGAINSISGFIVAKYAEDFSVPLDKAMEIFLNSNTYKLLSDKETGFYFDSIPEILDMFLSEKNGSCYQKT
jgi:NADPH-dependent curcumin reductase CurA